MRAFKSIYKLHLTSESELPGLVQKIKSVMPENAILLLQGSMAAGKTTFARCFCESLGLPMTQSPTYAIHQRYQNEKFCIDHLDLYRLENEDQLETAGLWDLLAQKSNLVIIEWSERIAGDWYPIDRKVYRLNIDSSSEERVYEFSQLV